MKSKIILFLLETNNGAKTDDAYIKTFIKNKYSQIYKSVKFEYMESKSQYKQAKIKKIVDEYKNNSNLIRVIVCIDTDDYEASPYDCELNKTIESLCIKNKYGFVWFCKDIEEVFWGERVPKSEKTIKAKQFVKNEMIKDIDLNRFKYNTFGKGHSNLANELNQCLKLLKDKNESS